MRGWLRASGIWQCRSAHSAGAQAAGATARVLHAYFKRMHASPTCACARTCSQRRSSCGRGTHKPATAPTSCARLHSAYSSPTNTLSLSVELQHNCVCSGGASRLWRGDASAEPAAAALLLAAPPQPPAWPPSAASAGRTAVWGICAAATAGAAQLLLARRAPCCGRARAHAACMRCARAVRADPPPAGRSLNLPAGPTARGAAAGPRPPAAVARQSRR